MPSRASQHFLSNNGIPLFIGLIIFLLGTCLGGFVTYYYFNFASNNSANLLNRIHSQQTQYKYINPLIATELNSKVQTKDSVYLIQLQALIDQEKKSGKILDPSVYYRNIETGVWAGINEDATFSPGKILKIPLMITYYKLAESNPDILNQKLKLQNNGPINTDYLATPKLQVGQEYSVDELIRAMIVDSDDRATNTLFDNVNGDQLNEIFSDLGVNFKEDKLTDDVISLKLYSLFFRLLYNSTYLTRQYSERAIELLVAADNTIGLGANVPKDVVIANRYGAHFIAGKNYYEMYECGIFYFPDRPFLLCASAKSKKISDLKDFFAQVGKLTYTAVSTPLK